MTYQGITYQKHRSREKTYYPRERLSSAQDIFSPMNPVKIVHQTAHQSKQEDPEETRRFGVRSLNLQMLLKDVFSSSIASMAAHIEISPDRLRSLLNDAVSSEMAEHLEQVLNLPGGWLDNKRSAIDAEYLKRVIFGGQDGGQNESKSEQENAIEDKQGASLAASDDASAPQVMDAASETADDAKQAATPDVQTNDAASIGQPIAAQVSQTPPPAMDQEQPTRRKGKDDASIQSALVWVNDVIDKEPTRIRSYIRQSLRERLGRSQSTISTWLNGLRKPPEDALIHLTREFIIMARPSPRNSCKDGGGCACSFFRVRSGGPWKLSPSPDSLLVAEPQSLQDAARSEQGLAEIKSEGKPKNQAFAATGNVEPEHPTPRAKCTRRLLKMRPSIREGSPSSMI